SLNNQSLENPKNAKGLDSKSKLESKNPNKIQTAKIQDSKIQLESNPKDLAKLESNSPKLKDSKISKTSKDSMKLESSPKLDSKTRQKSNKESESKQPKKFQRAKSTCDSKQSKESTNSKNSSKLKSFIRTIPISIALASALSSQAVAEWYHVHKPGNQETKTIINNGTINQNLNLTTFYYISLKGTTDTTNLTINYDLTGGGDAAGGPQNGLITLDSANEVGGTITNNANFSVGGSSKRALVVNNRAILKSFVNNASLKHTGSNSLIYVRAGGTIQNITNNGEMSVAGANQGWKSVIRLEDSGNLTGSRVDAINFIGTSTTSNVNGGTKQNVISIGSATSSIGTITARDNATIDGNFAFDTGTIGNITFQDSARMTGNISLANSAKITNGITIGGNSSGGSGNNASLTGDISLTNNSRIQGGIVLDNSANMTGSISLSTASNRDNITIDSINIGNGSTMTGNISLSTENGGGNITIDSINIGNGSTMTGDISVVGNSKITDTITIDGILDGNVSAIWNTGGNGTINQMDISGEITKKVQLDNETKISTLNLNGGTITGGINFQGLTTNSNGDTATIVNLTLNSDAYIGGIDIGNTSGGNAKGAISTLTLNGTSSIGSIVNNIGTISTLTLGGTSSIGTIANSATIANLNLSENGTITNGITNASGGTISNITLASSNTINNGITNDGVITEINHNVAGVENAVTNNAGGSISKLIISQGTIEYNGEGDITEELSVKGGATLSMNAGSGTITMNGAVGSKLNLESGSTFKGSLKNTGSISSWSNVSNIEGSFINDAGANIGSLSAGQIAENLLNKGNIGDLTIDNVVGTLSNESEITTLSVQNRVANGILNSGNIQTLTLESNADLGSVGVSNDGVITSLNNHKAGMQITNAQGIGTLAVDANTTYAGAGSITNALDIDGAQTQFTISNGAGNNGTLTLAENANTANSVKTITNEGTIIGNLINTLTTDWIGGTLEGNFTNNSGATLESLSNGTITGNLINAGSIVSLDSGTIGGSLDNQAGGIINTLHSSVVENLSNAGVVKDFIVDSDMDYTGNGSITNSMTILNNNTLNIGNAPSNGTININFGASATGTIGNAGTINGNITNLDTSTIKNFVNESTGKIDGDIINKGIITSFTNSGSFEGNLTNDKTIGNLTTGAITGSIANSGEINTLNVTGNVTNGITNKASSTITTLTINNGASLGNNGIANEGNIGTLDINANTTYSGDGNITNKIDVESGDTLTIGSGSDTLKFNATNGTITNAGIINGTINNIKGSSILDFDNSGSITGIINNGHIAEFTNSASGIIDNFVNDYTISFFENNGVIKDFSGNGIIYGVLNSNEITGDFENVATSLKNTGIITGNVQLIGNQQNCGNDICITSDLINEGIITGTFTNTADKEMNAVQNTGVMGGISNAGNITTINTGSITGSITNSGEITTLNVTGNVDNGITNNSNITNLTINKGVNLGNNGITNNAAIGNFTNKANITYSGNGSITGNFSNTKDSTITLNDDLILNGNGNAFRNDGILKGTISNIGALSSFTNTGSITGLESGNITGLLSNSNTGIIDNLVVNGNVSQMQNAGNIADAIIKSEITNGIINGDSNYKQATIGKLDIQASLGSNGLQNAGTITSLINNFSNTKLNNDGNIGSLDIQKNLNYSGSGSITNSIKIASNTTLTTSGITLNANKGSVNNEGILAGILTLEGSSNSVTNSGSITTIINNANNSSLTNNSNIGALAVNGNLTYKGNGSDRITQALVVAANKTLTINGSGSNNGTLSFKSTNGTINNAGTIAGNLSNVKDSTITSFTNSGIITGDLYNDGHIDTLTNTGTMGTIYNRSKNTIKNLLNGTNSVIAGIDNSNGKYNTLENQGTILGDIKNDNGTITNLFNTNSGTIEGNIDNGNGIIENFENNGTITGKIISNGNSNIGTIINAGVINSSHTINDTGSIQDKTNDAISLDTITNVVTAISNSGSINGNVRVAGNSEVNVIENSKVIAGCIILEGGRIGKINNNNGATANCMHFSNGASVGGLNNDGTIEKSITNDSGSITVNNSGSGSIGEIITSNGGNTTIINGGKDIMEGGHIGTITNTGSNSNTHIDGWTLDNPENPSNPIIIADGSNTDGIHLKEDSIFVSVKPEEGKTYDYYDYIQNEKGDSIGDQFSQDDELFNALTFIDILTPTDNGDGTYSVGLDT
ncbi:hypothetical protein, partial [Helicobacter pullorum]|uniref:hypothetical protein n=1 Tax=Helicobacter pullorum TaxID=35818 RepID=UPI0013151B89